MDAGVPFQRPTRIVQAAIRTEDGQVVTLPRPARHQDIVSHMMANGFALEQIEKGEKGFTTDTMPFVRRQPARRIAEKAGQMIQSLHPSQLFTDDLWRPAPRWMQGAAGSVAQQRAGRARWKGH